MGLFLTRDSKLLAMEELQDFKRQDVKSLKREMSVMMARLLNQLPYSGIVMSRSGTRVTVKGFPFASDDAAGSDCCAIFTCQNDQHDCQQLKSRATEQGAAAVEP